MGGEGSMKAMIDSLRNNRKLLRNKSRFTKERSFLNLKETYLKGASGKPRFKPYSKEAIKKIKAGFQRKHKQEKVLFAFLGLLFFLLFIFLGTFLIKEVLQEQNDRKQLNIQKQEQAYLKHIAFGDRWFSESNWHNAIFYYKKALELYPNDYDSSYRLLQAYGQNCEKELEDCAKAKDLLDELLVKFPGKKSELTQLKDVLNYEYGI